MRRLCLFAAGFCLATALCVLLQCGAWILGIGAALAAVSIGAFFLKGRWARRTAIVTLGLAVGLCWFALYSAAMITPAKNADGQTREVTATASGFSRRTRYGSSVEAKLRLDGRSYDAVIYLKESEPDVCPGDTLRLTAELAMANGEKDAGSVYLRSRGTVLIAKARSALTLTKAETIPVRYLPAYASHALREKIDELFPADTAGFLAALLTGQRDGLSYAQKTDLTDAGIYHTVAVSGMHVSILLGMIVMLCGAHRRLSALIGLPVVFFFVLMTGAPASAVRAGLMQALLLLAPLLGRENDFPTSISAVLMLLLAANPWAAFDVGLQLSFASVCGIALFSGRIYQYAAKGRYLAKRLKTGGLGAKLLRVALTAAASSLGAMGLSAPLSAYHFGVLSILAPITNALCLWAVTVIFAVGIVTVLAGFLLPPVSFGLAWLLSWLVRYVFGVSALVSRIPFAALYLQNGYMWVLAALCYVALIILLLRPRLVCSRVSALSLLVSFCAVFALCYLEFHRPNFSFTALDVGQGQCLVYQSKRGTCVIDCGGMEDESGEEAAEFLRANAEYRVEALVLTHYDADHVNGACQLMRRVKVDTLYLPDFSDDGLRGAIERTARERGVDIVYVREDRALALGGAELQIFALVSDDSSNNASLSVLASCAEYDILVTGDMAQSAERRLLSAHELPDLELFVAGHHGAKTSTSRTLLELTAPDCVVISAGADNSFGHPAPETLDRIRQTGAAIYRTDVNGTITIRG